MKNLTYQIISIMFFSFLIPFTTLYLMDEWVDAASYENIEQKIINSDKDNPNKLKILILGSSRVTMLDAIYIDNYVMEQGYFVDVFNEGVGATRPSDMILDVGNQITRKPDIVLIGIDMAQHLPEQRTGDGLQPVTWDCSSKIPTLPQMFYELIPIERKFLGLDLSNFDNPKLTTLTLLSNIFFESDSFKQSDKEEENEINKKQSANFNVAENKIIGTKEEIKRRIDDKAYRFSHIVESDGVQAKTLGKIIEIYHEEEIKVVIFTTPVHGGLLEISPSCSIDEFEKLVEKLSHNHNIESYSFLEKYSNLPIWRDVSHITHSEEGEIFSEDFAKMIVDVIGN